MRILVISNYYAPLELGGWGQLTRDVSQRLKQRGHQVCVLTSNHRTEEIDSAEPDVHRVLHLESADHVQYHLQYTLDFRRHETENKRVVTRAINEFEPDVVFVNGMWNMSHQVAKRAESLCPGRVVYYMASYWPAEVSAHTAYWRDTAVSPGVRLPKKILGEMVTRFWLRQEPRNRLEFRLVLCVSAFLRDKIVARAGIPEAQTRVVHNGVELDAFTGRNPQIDIETLRLLYAGRLSPDKGVHTVIESLGFLKDRHLPMPISLSVVGAGAEAYETRLRRLAEENGVRDMVQFRGRVPREQMPEILAEHDVLLFPSVWAEPLARMVQEAMACELVVIGTPTGGTPEILYDGENGFMFDAEDAAMLADKIALVASDSQQRVSMAREARRTVETHFSLSRMIDELESYFESVLQ